MIDSGRPLDGSRVVDEDVDRTAAGQPLCERGDRGAVGEVDAVALELPAETLDLRLHLAAGRLHRRTDPDDVGSRGRERRRDREAQPAAGAGDHGEAAVQVEARQAGLPPECGHAAPPARQSTRTFITRPPWARLSNAAGASRQRGGGRDQSIDRDRSLRQELDRGREVGAVVDARAEDRQLLPEDPLHVDLSRLRVDADRHEPAAGAECVHREIEAGLGAGHLERRRRRRRPPTTRRAWRRGPPRAGRGRRGPAPPTTERR